MRLAPVADRIELFEGESHVLPSILALEAAGHTPGETVLQLSSAGEGGLLLGDIVHTQAELIDDDPSGTWCFGPHFDTSAANASVDRFRKILTTSGSPSPPPISEA